MSASSLVLRLPSSTQSVSAFHSLLRTTQAAAREAAQGSPEGAAAFASAPAPQLVFEVTDASNEGLLIEFFNDPSRRLFQQGKADMTDYGKMLFGIVAWTLAKHDTAMSTAIEVEGHTGRDFRSSTGDKEDDKWSVSTARSLAVRKHLSSEGVKEKQFNKIAGFGDTRPHRQYKDNPDHAFHNRVSIMVRAKQYEPGRP